MFPPTATPDKPGAGPARRAAAASEHDWNRFPTGRSCDLAFPACPTGVRHSKGQPRFFVIPPLGLEPPRAPVPLLFTDRLPGEHLVVYGSPDDSAICLLHCSIPTYCWTISMSPPGCVLRPDADSYYSPGMRQNKPVVSDRRTGRKSSATGCQMKKTRRGRTAHAQSTRLLLPAPVQSELEAPCAEPLEPQMAASAITRGSSDNSDIEQGWRPTTTARTKRRSQAHPLATRTAPI